MYVIVEQKDLEKREDIMEFGLCFVRDIPKNYSDLVNGEIVYLPNPDYNEDTKNYYAYFSKGKAWGDDWDDAPYEHNAGCPYGDKQDILVVPFAIRRDSEVFLPEDHCKPNSPYSIEDINNGMVPWIFVRYKLRRFGTGFMAGINPIEFIKKLTKANNYEY